MQFLEVAMLCFFTLHHHTLEGEAPPQQEADLLRGWECEDKPCGDCWCQYVRYELSYYTTQRCVEKQVPYKKKCCRYVPKYYEVQRCRYIPEYYTETICRNVPEFYCEDACKTCQEWVCEEQCEYVPKYYWKRVCSSPSCETPCPE